MNRRLVQFVGLLVVIFGGWAIIAGNRLPAELRAQITQEQTNLTAAKQRIINQQRTVSSEAAAQPELFQVNGFDRSSATRFTEATAALMQADRMQSELNSLKQQNRKSSKDKVEELLRSERERRSAATSEADAVDRDAQMRAGLKQNFPATLTAIEANARSLAGADFTPLTAKVEKAERDWPAKKDDLQARLNTVVEAHNEARQWGQTAIDLAARPAAQLTTADYVKGLEIEESLAEVAGKDQGRDLPNLSQQLYTSWDNVLVDLDKNHGEYRERLKHIATTVPAPGDKGTTHSDEQWRDVPPDEWQIAEKNVGMAIAHKPLGKYDSEADHIPEPPGFAYMASPEQGRNQYGYWDHRNGTSVWTWLPEYLILRDLLSNHYYQPVPSYDWLHYRQAQQYGKTYYGNETSGAPKYGSHGTFTLQRYANSHYVQTGGFSGSKYGSSGGFSGSHYGSGTSPSFSSSPSASGSRFGSSSSAAHKFGSSSSGGMRFGSSHSSGHSFGGRHR